MRNFLIGFFIFALAFIVGSVFRVGWLFAVQRPLFQYTYLDADIRAVKTGGKTPQDTWNIYISALEKGDINGALQFIYPESRESEKIFLEEEKKKDNLKGFLSSHHKEIRKFDGLKNLKKNEKRFTYLTQQEEKEFIEGFKTDQNLKPLADEPIENLREFIPDIVFFYNRYSRLWLIK